MTVYLKKGEQARIMGGHPWIFDNEIKGYEGTLTDGGIAEVRDSDGKFLGRAFVNSHSKIALRMLTWQDEEINTEFFHRAISKAISQRKKDGYTGSYRAVFAESDFLPGLIVDKFEDYLSVQLLTLGMEQRKQELFKILVEELSPKGIFERSDVPVREKEGLAQYKGVVYGEVPERVIIDENGLKMYAHIHGGQKTGYFLDQKDNHFATRKYTSGRVLDCFTYMGGFALSAAAAGAQEVIAADISELAAQYVQHNAQLNGLTNVTTQLGNCFDLLADYDKRGERFDTVILDPPAFCKSRATQKSAYRGYKEINLRGIHLLREGGYLITCSCSHYMYPQMFFDMLRDAAVDSGRQLRIVANNLQPLDHPIRIGFDESQYLKCIIAQVL